MYSISFERAAITSKSRNLEKEQQVGSQFHPIYPLKLSENWKNFLLQKLLGRGNFERLYVLLWTPCTSLMKRVSFLYSSYIVGILKDSNVLHSKKYIRTEWRNLIQMCYEQHTLTRRKTGTKPLIIVVNEEGAAGKTTGMSEVITWSGHERRRGMAIWIEDVWTGYIANWLHCDKEEDKRLKECMDIKLSMSCVR